MVVVAVAIAAVAVVAAMRAVVVDVPILPAVVAVVERKVELVGPLVAAASIPAAVACTVPAPSISYHILA